jgi:tetratricopeptide (TPR) repeat protein|eukprot:TRINITY_DN1408_c0_g1_i1.p1 TRINITY_DN1408_c0_g1~~TRINITY_DN1408_c0_g1_i1.p1  ORF type:complete len:288 (-),score=61.04 TRINITY_DN1408_c0_g1_i1:105-968(-)
MEPGEYEALISKANLGNSAAAVDLLQAMRTHKIHQPEIALLHGGRLLGTYQRQLGTEVWTVMEQVFLAASELGATEWREYCLKRLTKKFPSSMRVERLKGLNAESSEDWDSATQVYQQILKDKPEDTIVKKRLIAIHKQQGNITDAISEINSYLDTFCLDAEMWHELGELYMDVGSLSRAVFCFEELLLSNPRSMYHILTYAELLYSTGDYELSRKYFSLSTYLDGNCLRGLWGMYACNLMLAEKEKHKEKIEELQKMTLSRLNAIYKSLGASHGKVAISMLENALS